LVIIRGARARFQIVHVLGSSAIVTHFVCIRFANPRFANPVPTGLLRCNRPT
jgi:hypothetical protein